MKWGNRRNKKPKRPDSFDYDAPDTPHVERRTKRSERRIVVSSIGQKQREANQNAQKRKVAEYKAQRALLANEYRQNQKPDYSHIFDYGDDGLSQTQMEISDAIRSWVRYGLQKKMTYDQIKSIVVSEFRLHKDIVKRFNIK